jgi:hypothetical protein
MKVTVGPGGQAHEWSSIGVAAHICAAAPGGPRFDPAMSPQARASIDNGIWLCNNCSRKVDNDTDRFTVPLLTQWKQNAEARALLQVGKRHANDEDVRQQLRIAMGARGAGFVPESIVNVHQAAEQELASLDPRFSVRSEYKNGRPRVLLEAKEQVGITFRVDSSVTQAWQKEVRALLRHGRTLRLPASGVAIEGSRLFDVLAPSDNRTTTIQIEAVQRDAFVRLRLLLQDGSVASEVELVGMCVGGTHSATVEARGVEGVLKLLLRQRNDRKAGPSVATVLEFDPACWSGLDVRQLRGFKAAKDFFSLAACGGSLQADVFVADRLVLKAAWALGAGDRYLAQAANQLAYLDRARILSDFLGARITFVPDHLFDYEEHLALAGAAAMAVGPRVDVFTSPVTCTLVLVPGAGEARLALANASTFLLRFVEAQGKALRVYGQEVHLPRSVVDLSEVVPMCSKDPERLEDGEELSITWAPRQGRGQATMSYLDRDSNGSSLPWGISGQHA